MVKIGDLEIGEFPLLLAPMEDVSDPPFRKLCKKEVLMLCIQNLYHQKGLSEMHIKAFKNLIYLNLKDQLVFKYLAITLNL